MKPSPVDGVGIGMVLWRCCVVMLAIKQCEGVGRVSTREDHHHPGVTDAKRHVDPTQMIDTASRSRKDSVLINKKQTIDRWPCREPRNG